MKKSALTAALAGAALAVTPIAAVAQDRASAPVSEESNIGGSPLAGIIALAVAGLLVTVLVTDVDRDDDTPISA